MWRHLARDLHIRHLEMSYPPLEGQYKIKNNLVLRPPGKLTRAIRLAPAFLQSNSGEHSETQNCLNKTTKHKSKAAADNPL
jgi:hypothetical protein